MSTHNLKLEARAVAHLVEATCREMDVTEDDAHLIAGSETNLLEAASAALRQLDRLAADTEAVKGLAKLYASRARLLEERQGRIREALRDAMETSGLKTLRLPEATLSTSIGKPALRIIDEGELPPWFFRLEVVRTLDRAGLARTLAAGETVEGAILDPGRPFLTVRR
jgi:hypothetical protein